MLPRVTFVCEASQWFKQLSEHVQFQSSFQQFLTVERYP